MNIFVGNLSFEANEGDVKKLFEGFGNVTSVVIVMRKEKKTPKSRGFGFVQMPDEQQTLAAIGALNGKEFMGRVLNVNSARPNPTGIGLPIPIKEGPKAEAQAVVELKEKRQPGTYKGGRRTHSYTKRRGLGGMQEEAKLRQGSQGNPMPWHKRKDQAKPWQKSSSEHKPWKKTGGEARSWKKAEGEFKPWRKSEGCIKPWKKPTGDAKHWKKAEGDAKPWSKSNGRPQKSRFNPSTSSFDKLRTNPERAKRFEGSLDMVRGNGERSRTKGRRKPGGYKR
jgi:RNA recognition motif-containing protein